MQIRPKKKKIFPKTCVYPNLCIPLHSQNRKVMQIVRDVAQLVSARVWGA